MLVDSIVIIVIKNDFFQANMSFGGVVEGEAQVVVGVLRVHTPAAFYKIADFLRNVE